MDHSTPFDGGHGSFGPYDNHDFSNFDINFGPFASGSQDASLTQGLDSLGTCNNNENACLDQRCFDHYNGATNCEIELDSAVNNLALDASLMGQVDPMAALQSIHQAQQAHQAHVPSPSSFALHDNAQMQWVHNPLLDWGVDIAPAQNQGAGSIACNSNCGDCCYNASCAGASCAGLDAGHSVHSTCCFDESCSIQQEPCISENCHGAARPCYDANCMVPSQTVSATPESASVPTPRTFDFDPMIITPSDNINPLVEESAPAQARPKSNVIEKEDQFRCYWMCEDGYMCPERFLNSDELHRHCKTAHLGPMKKEGGGFTCQWSPCSRKDGKAFTQKSKLERHLQTHTGFKPVKCEICGLALSAKQSLEQHLRTHTGETPWMCPFPGCGQSFKQQSAHTMHVRTHTGEKPLQCEICGKRFSESSNLSKHRKTHDELGGEFRCGECGKDFRRHDHFRRHMSMRH